MNNYHHAERAHERLLTLVDELRTHPAEQEWYEFKQNQFDPAVIGKLISAIANAARLADQHVGYVIWGVRDGDHEVVGTSLDMHAAKIKRQPAQFWLEQELDPAPVLTFHELHHASGHRLVVLEIPAVTHTPVKYKGIPYIRIGEATPSLHAHPERERLLWTKIRPYAWETGNAESYQTSDDVLQKLDYAAYFRLTQHRLPDNRDGILEKLTAERLIRKDVGGHFDITNVGAILLANDITMFPNLQRKAVRLIQYEGKDKTSSVIKRSDGKKGYANGFEGLLGFIESILPNRESIEGALRTTQNVYPPIALRETIANALIHQDFMVSGTSPVISIFQDRIEITNAGKPLIPVEHFLDYPPRSRNEILAALMRRMGICEEQGSGFDKAVGAIEAAELPPLDFRAEDEFTITILHTKKSYASFTTEERLNTCYQHAVMCWLNGNRLTNTSLRERFGIDASNASIMSRLTADARRKGLIKIADLDAPNSGYIPFWA
jgi:predicted HTH transcriptional regulator